jgi:hypothetical protein
MSKGNTTENDILKYIFNATAMPNYGTGTLYIALHTADPGEGGDQTTSETAYTSYARVAMTRDNTKWTVTNNTTTNAVLIQFPQCTGSPGSDITHVSIGTLSSGAGQIIYSGALNANLALANLIQPQFGIGALTITED